MSDLVASVEVAAPAGTTWLALTDWNQQGRWMLGTEVRVVSGNGRSVGSRIEAFTAVAGIGVKDQMEITSWEPPVRCTMRHLGSVVRGTGAFHVQAKGPQRSVFIWSEHLTPPFGILGRLGWPVVRPVFALGLRHSMRNFARFAESYVVGE
ncbi:Polyketide cyclase / dehydrase and lipid transport [Saccharomonospora marina XMU15]|uniref:Polyketide cyclase / dehydrase and lipid transport n=1 Tax=Saccharomonospora marina XMU15 TaxID=882083 RepID=H5X9C7_9PSEU|nr:SRPBCC family protein [Saccharomonospora marina]EHR49229.1 Polyketide cyclase / dehydrase and lipid transport [Saccharomonospora marina XMU15]